MSHPPTPTSPPPPPKAGELPSRGVESGSAWRVSGLGFELASSIAGMALLGWAIDKWLVKSGNLALIICTTMGIIGGGYNFIRRASSLSKQAARDYRTSHPRGVTMPLSTKSPQRTPDDDLDKDDQPDDDTLTGLWSDDKPKPS